MKRISPSPTSNISAMAKHAGARLRNISAHVWKASASRCGCNAMSVSVCRTTARAAGGARGRNWLFFGNPHFRSDFLYQTEWHVALKNGTLHRLDLAFSRDQSEKIHVQHRLRGHGRELHAWLLEGAHLYVCGDAGMARDVHAELIDLIVKHGGLSPEDASAWLDGLQLEGRYARDVY